MTTKIMDDLKKHFRDVKSGKLYEKERKQARLKNIFRKPKTTYTRKHKNFKSTAEKKKRAFRQIRYLEA